MIERGQDDSPFPTADLRLRDFWTTTPACRPPRPRRRLPAPCARGAMRDAAAGRTLVGPHRADLLVRHSAEGHGGRPVLDRRAEGAADRPRLAHARLVREMTGATPLLLLDEIAAHLDDGRRAALFDLIDALGGQAFMTGTDRGMFAALGDRAQFLPVARAASSTSSEPSRISGTLPAMKSGMTDERTGSPQRRGTRALCAAYRACRDRRTRPAAAEGGTGARWSARAGSARRCSSISPPPASAAHVIDDDAVSLSNLQRQIIHDTGAIGMAKTDSAARAHRPHQPACRAWTRSRPSHGRKRRRSPHRP